MKPLSILLLFLLSACAHAQPQSGTDPARVVADGGDGWYALRFPAAEGTRSPCCWKGNWNSGNEIGCSLAKQHRSYGTRSDSPLEDTIVSYAQVSNGEVSAMKVVGEQCPMDAAGETVNWMPGTDTAATLDWLESLAREGDGDRVAHAALWALSLHASSQAGDRLYAMATDQHCGRSEEAVFAISQLPTGTNGPMLLELAGDPGAPRAARKQALFWLAHSDDEQAVAELAELLSR